MKMFSFFLFLFAAMETLYAQATPDLNFNVYGVGHISIDNINYGDSRIHIASNSSRLGLKGAYEIHPGLSFIFQYESGVDLTGRGQNDGNGGAESSGQFFTKTRPSFIGLKGSMGTVLVGHMPALAQWANDYNLFADQLGDLRNLWAGSGLPGRLDDVIYYRSPAVNGFDLAFTYKPEDQEDEDTDHSILKLNYANAGFKLGLAFASIGQGKRVDGLGLDEHTATALTFGYYSDRFTIGGGYQDEADIGGFAGNDRDSYTIGVSLRVDEKGTIKSQYAMSNGSYDDSDASQIAIAYNYALDANTIVYIAYAKVDNDAAVQFSANGKGHGDQIIPDYGDDPSGLSLGIVAKFDLGLSH